MEATPNLWIIPLLPLAGAAINGFFGPREHKSSGQLPVASGQHGHTAGHGHEGSHDLPARGFVHSVAIGSVALAFLYAVYLFFTVTFEHPIVERVGTWIIAGKFDAGFSFYLDPLSMIMTLVVSGVGMLIHIYSAGYMAHEGGYYRYFCYLNLFTFFMLTLVLAGNYLLLFVGWEGVGLCSYLLIGFWFKKKSASDAGKKAFLVNRIGDFGFILALILMFGVAGSLDFEKVFAAVGRLGVEPVAGVLTAICLLLLVGATGKSAQIPLYVWLPDAMEGPTPVSALIHAATMVTAGVYMTARSALLFERAPVALSTVAVVGCLTALFAASIGLVQNDIKRVLAYSTVSQLGYMFLGCGVAAFSAGIFHLMTHAFFKALLFLGSGSVIHAMAGQQDMRHMGGLKSKISITYWTFFIGCLAIAGVPPFAGFFSKDEILWKAYSGGHTTLWGLGMLTAAMTAFYMFRLFFMTFHGEHRSEEASDAHESPPSMTGVLVTLAVLSIIGGLVGIPHAWGGENRIEKFLEPAFGVHETGLTPVALTEHVADVGTERLFSLWAVLAGIAGITLAWFLYVARPRLTEELAQSFSRIHKTLLNKYYVDEIYQTLIVNPLVSVSRSLLWQVVDVGVIDGAANGLAGSARGFGGWARRLQSGHIRSYATWVLLGAVFVLFFMGVLWAK